MKLTRAKLESLVGDLIKSVDQALQGRAEGCRPVDLATSTRWFWSAA